MLEGQMSIYDYMELTEEKFPPVINDLSKELKSLLQVEKEEYEIWEHVPRLGYRYFCSAGVTKKDYEVSINAMEGLENKYKKQDLQISTIPTPCYEDDSRVNLHISTLWTNKDRAKSG